MVLASRSTVITARSSSEINSELCGVQRAGMRCQRPGRCAGRAMNNRDMQKVLLHLRKDPVVKAVYDAKSEEIGPNIFRFKAEIGQHPAQCPASPRYLPHAT